MQIFVRTPAGSTVALDVEPSTTVAEVKSLLNAPESSLVHTSSYLEDETLLADSVHELDTVEMVFSILGGGKVHGSLSRAGKVRGATPKVSKQEKARSPVGRAKKRHQYKHRYAAMVSTTAGGKRAGPNKGSGVKEVPAAK